MQAAEARSLKASTSRSGAGDRTRIRRSRAASGERRIGRAHSYTCRYLRTNRIAITFISRVSTNSVMPTAKIVLYPIEPAGVSPLAVAPMNAVIVS